jgi:hypothetical protein
VNAIPETLPPWALWAVFAGAALLLVLLVVLIALRRRRARSTARQLESISHDLLTDIIVPKADEGEIQIGYALLTERGVLVVETKEVAGVVFASDRMDDWTVMAGDRRYTFANPQPTLYDRIAAVAQVVGEIPVDGVVVFPDAANFSKGRPRHVTTLAGLLDDYPRVDGNRDRSRVAEFLPHWERLRREAVSARVGSLAG